MTGPSADPLIGQIAALLGSTRWDRQAFVVAEQIRQAEQAARECDLMLAVGSTLAVYPAAGVVPLARGEGARIVIVNGDATEMDHHADAVLRGSISEILPRIVGEA